jgi:hypothetical protein
MKRALAIACTAVLWALAISPAADAGPPLAVLGAVAATGPAYLDSYSVVCPATQGGISISPTGYVDTSLAVECSAPESGETGATTLVAIGDSGLADPATGTRNSPVICGSGCNRSSWSGNIRKGYCRADTGTVTLYCAALVPGTAAP